MQNKVIEVKKEENRARKQKSNGFFVALLHFKRNRRIYILKKNENKTMRLT